MHASYRQSSFQERQLHQPEDNRTVLFDAPQDDAESHSKISGAIMIDTHELVLEFSEECVDFQEFEGPQIDVPGCHY